MLFFDEKLSHSELVEMRKFESLKPEAGVMVSILDLQIWDAGSNQILVAKVLPAKPPECELLMNACNSHYGLFMKNMWNQKQLSRVHLIIQKLNLFRLW